MALAAVAAGYGGWLVLDAVFPFPAERLDAALRCRPVWLLDRDGEPLAWRLDAEEQWRIPVPLERISPWLVRATVAAEDRRFYRHAGVDPVAVARAAGQNLWSGRRRSGASTLTMQTIRLLWPRPRDWRAKAVEAFRAVQLERLRTKGQILELYLNLAPYGGNVVGAEAAAQRYFGKAAERLSPGEAALLAGIPQSPTRYQPRRRPAAALARRDYVLDRLGRDGELIPRAAAAARAEPPVSGAHRPDESPVRHALPALWRAAPDDGTPVVRTTLDRRVQAVIVETLRRFLPSGAERGPAAPGVPDGVAAVVVEVPSGAVRGWIGGMADADVPGGQIDGARAWRQPGSLLKPFLFAGALDQGLLDPGRLVDDDELDWRGYRPRNADHGYRGVIAAGEALRLSRNPPAVRQLHDYGPERFADLLRRLGLRAPEPGRSGLAMALGVDEQRLLDLAAAYADLARLGVHRPLQFIETPESPEPAAVSVFSPGAGWLTLAALADDPAPRRAWKTGTSWNQRDGWAVALSPGWVAAVWRGRLGGGPAPGLTGVDEALPIARTLLEQLDRNPDPWPRPADVVDLTRCRISGKRLGLYCVETVDGPTRLGREALPPCLDCLPGAAPAAGRPGAVVASAAPPAPLPTPGGKTVIRAPREGTRYIADRRMNGVAAATLAFQTRAEAAEETVWFIDGEEAGRARGGEVLRLVLPVGRHEASALTGDRSGQVAFEVVAPTW